MSKDDLPEIPSWDELGISPEELKELEAELEKGEPDTAGDGEGSNDPTPRTAPEPVPGPSETGPPPPPGPGGGSPGGEEAAPAARPTPPPAPSWRGPVTALLLLGATWAVSSYRAAPRPLDAAAADSLFSAERSMGHVAQIARAPHPPGSPEHARVREYLVDQLRALGLQPEIQTAVHVIGQGERRRAVTVRNILARIPGADPTGGILLTAHYDGREVSRAAGDDGSGVATILEALRALSTGEPLRNEILILLTDAEELGLVGARAFVADHAWMDDITLVISVEMRGGGGPSIMFETGQDNGWIVRQLAAANPHAFTNSLTYEVYRRLPNDTDFTPFKEAGKQGLNFAAIANAHVYHQAYDSPEHLSLATLQHHGVNVLSMVRHLGDLELTTVSAPDRVYFSVPYLGTVVYVRTVAYGLSVLLVLGLLMALVFARRSGARVAGMAVGVVGGLALVGLAWGTGLLLVRVLPSFHPETGQLHGSLFHKEGWYVAALVAAVLAFGGLVFGTLRRWFSPSELTAGAVILPALLAAASVVWVPLGAMNLQWPALAGVLGVFVMAGVGRDRRPGFLRWVLVVLLAVPVLTMLAPLTELLWLAMNISLAPALGGLVAIAVLCALPAVETLREPNGWWAPVAGAVAAAALVGIGVLNAAPDATRPAPSTLLYALDRESGDAWWLTDGPESNASGEEARQWVAERVGTLEDPRSFAAYFGRGVQYAAARADVRDVAPLDVVPASDSSTADGVTVVGVRSGIGAELLVFTLPEGGPALRSVGGVALDDASSIRVLEHWGEPVDRLHLEFDRVPGDTLRFGVVEHLFRPAEVVGTEPFRRPTHLAPNVRRFSDRVLVRSVVSMDGDGSVRVSGMEEGTEAAAGGDEASSEEPVEIEVDPPVVTPPDSTGQIQPQDTIQQRDS